MFMRPIAYVALCLLAVAFVAGHLQLSGVELAVLLALPVVGWVVATRARRRRKTSTSATTS